MNIVELQRLVKVAEAMSSFISESIIYLQVE